MSYTPWGIIIFLYFFLLLQYASADLVHDVCKQTRNNKLCLETIKASGDSSKADTKGLGAIMIRAARKKAAHTIVYIRQLTQNHGNSDAFKKCLKVCYDDYRMVVTAFIPNALQSLLSSGSSFDAAVSMLMSADQLLSCQDSSCDKSSSNLNDRCNDYGSFTQLVADVLRVA